MMKLYVAVFCALAVVATVAVWPKPTDPHPGEGSEIQGKTDKPINDPQTTRLSGGEDIPAPDGMKVTAHPRRAGEPGEDGWYLAESTHGGFSVKLPNVFNDMTATTKAENGVTVILHTVGTRTDDQTQYTASHSNRKDNKPIPEALESFVESLAAGRKEKIVITQAGMQGVQIKATTGRTAAIMRVLLSEAMICMLGVENRAGAVITPAMERNAPIFFESFRLK